jgi:hypothetical protein
MEQTDASPPGLVNARNIPEDFALLPARKAASCPRFTSLLMGTKEGR